MIHRESRSDAVSMSEGVVAIAAPALHIVTDVMKWHQHGFGTAQLWLNSLAFLAMPWVLLGPYAAHDGRPDLVGFAGALLYGTAFIYGSRVA
jgi:hypothetical protein